MAWGADRDIPCPTLFQRGRNGGLTIVRSWHSWQSWVGLIPGGWLTQLPIKIQLLRTAAAPRTPPAHRPSHSATPTPETNFLLETGRGIILALFVEGLDRHDHHQSAVQPFLKKKTHALEFDSQCTMCCLGSTIAPCPKTEIQKPLSHGKKLFLRLFFLCSFRMKTLKLVSLFIFRHWKHYFWSTQNREK